MAIGSYRVYSRNEIGRRIITHSLQEVVGENDTGGIRYRNWWQEEGGDWIKWVLVLLVSSDQCPVQSDRLTIHYHDHSLDIMDQKQQSRENRYYCGRWKLVVHVCNALEVEGGITPLGM